MSPEEILQRAIDGVPAFAIFALDSQGVALTWNEGVERVLGYPRDVFIGCNMDELFTAEERARGEPERERAAASRRGTAGDFRWHVKRDGTRFWAEGVLHAVRDEHGRIAGFTKIMRDGTRDKELQDALERSHAELEELVEARTRALVAASEELRISEGRFTQVFRIAPAAMVLTTREDDILDVNGAFESITGYPRDEVVGRNAKAMGFWGSPEDQRKLREARATEQGFDSLELQLRTKEGQVRNILGSAVVVDIDHEVGLVKMFLDITDRKQNERHLMVALHEVMQDTSWLAQRVVEKLAHARGASGEGQAVSDLTAREREVLELVARGLSNEQIIQLLDLALSTVRNHVVGIYAKIGVNSRAEAVVWARDRGLGRK